MSPILQSPGAVELFVSILDVGSSTAETPRLALGNDRNGVDSGGSVTVPRTAGIGANGDGRSGIAALGLFDPKAEVK
jgi:hypothetical protein